MDLSPLRLGDLLQKHASISAAAISPGYSRRCLEARPGNAPTGVTSVPVSASLAASEASFTRLGPAILPASAAVIIDFVPLVLNGFNADIT